MQVRGLNLEDINDIMALSEQYYPSNFLQPKEDLEYNFKEMTDKNCNFSVGLFDDDILVGYIIAWLDESLVEDNDEDIIFIDDLLITPEYKSHLYFLLFNFVRLLKQVSADRYPIEAVARQSFIDLLHEHLEVFNRLGYDLVSQYSYFSEDFSEDMTWVRLEVVSG